MIIVLIVLGMLFVASLSGSMAGYRFYQYSEYLWIAGFAIMGAIIYGAYRMK